MIKVIASIVAAMISASAVASNEIRISAIPRASQSPILYGIQERLPAVAEKHGIKDAKIIIVPSNSSALALNQLPAGDIDLVMAALPAVINKHIKDPGQLRMLAVVNTAIFTLVCKPYVKDIKDIKNKKYVISMQSRNTSPHLAAKYIGKTVFGDPGALEGNLITQPADQAFQLMQDPSPGTVDCSLHGSPHNNLLEEKPGYNVLYRDDPVNGISSISNGIVITPKWLSKNEKLAKALIETINEVYAEFNRDKTRLVELFVKKDSINEDPKRLVRFYTQSQVRAENRITPGIRRMIEFSESVGYVAPGASKNLDGLIWRSDLLK